jgi:hypothetical protein
MAAGKGRRTEVDLGEEKADEDGEGGSKEVDRDIPSSSATTAAVTGDACTDKTDAARVVVVVEADLFLLEPNRLAKKPPPPPPLLELRSRCFFASFVFLSRLDFLLDPLPPSASASNAVVLRPRVNGGLDDADVGDEPTTAAAPVVATAGADNIDADLLRPCPCP